MEFDSTWENLVNLESRYRLGCHLRKMSPNLKYFVLFLWLCMQGRALVCLGIVEHFLSELVLDLKFIDLAPILLCRVKLWKHKNKTV